MKILLLSLLFSFSGYSFAEIYKHVDDDGRVTYSDSPQKGEKIEVDKLLNISDSKKQNPTWATLLSTSKKIQLEFKIIPTTEVFSLLSGYAKKHDDITLRYEIFHGKNIAVSVDNEPWAKVVQNIVSGESTYFLRYDRKNRVLTIYDHPI